MAGDHIQSTPRPALPARRATGNWTPAHEEIPRDWPEAIDVVGAAYEEARTAPLRFVSRRRAEPEEQDALACTRVPELTHADASEQEHYAKQDWPADAHPRPIAAEGLWLDGVYEEILGAIEDVVQDCATSERGENVARRETRIFKTELMQPLARRHLEGGGAFDLADPADVQLLQPYDDNEPVPPSVDGAFFVRWASWLGWQDVDMIRQVSVTGIESRSACTRATTVATHHGSLRANFAPAKAVVDADTRMGFVQRGRAHLWTIPAQMVPRNCVSQRKWKLRGDELTRTLKWRVTTEDSIGAQDEVLRNDGIDQEALPPTVLPTPQTLAGRGSGDRQSSRARHAHPGLASGAREGRAVGNRPHPRLPHALGAAVGVATAGLRVARRRTPRPTLCLRHSQHGQPLPTRLQLRARDRAGADTRVRPSAPILGGTAAMERVAREPPRR